jgi:hypothetical protein
MLLFSSQVYQSAAFSYCYTVNNADADMQKPFSGHERFYDLSSKCVALHGGEEEFFSHDHSCTNCAAQMACVSNTLLPSEAKTGVDGSPNPILFPIGEGSLPSSKLYCFGDTGAALVAYF